MDTARLIAALRSAIDEGAVLRNPREQEPDRDEIEVNYWASMPKPVSDYVLDTLKAEPELAVFAAAWLSAGTSGGRVEFSALAHWLVKQALITNPEETVIQFEKFIKQNAAEIVEVFAITGVTLRERVALPNGIDLFPLDCLPPSFGRLWINETFKNPFSGMNPPIIALGITHRVSPVITSATAPRSENPNRDREALDIHDRFRDTARCLTLVGPRSVAHVGAWAHIVSPGVPRLGGGAQMPLLQRGAPVPGVIPTLDITEPKEVVTGFLALPSKLRAELRTPVDRLNLAVGDLDSVDTAIDLGVALEALLLHEFNDNGELRYRLRLRGTALLGGSASERNATFDLLGKLYDLRSKAVHSGRIEESKREVLVPGCALCARLIRKVIELGKWPDWEALIVTGA